MHTDITMKSYLIEDHCKKNITPEPFIVEVKREDEIENAETGI